ncbi:MAG TPA: zinc-binding dehydrogenase [Mycobacteriales bacterium]|nr:zinc-binding dehydrogenase [Mycobacteriales bacterium]
MRAAVLRTDGRKEAIDVTDWANPEAMPGWVVVRVMRASLNQLDQMTVDERTELPRDAVIGSDAAGIVVETGEGVSGVSVGDEVVVLPSLWWGAGDDVQSADYEILGYPTQGTHAELVAVPAENVFPRPGRLTWDEAAALPLAGLTAWRAVMSRGALRAGETMIVTAASSGVGSLAVQIGHAVGARVIAVSSDQDKLDRACALGASGGVLRTSSDLAGDLVRAVDGAADLVVDSTGAHWPALSRALRPGGRMVTIGQKGSSEATLPVQTVYWRQLSVLGSSMGSPRDFAALLDHLDGATWAPVVDSVFDLEDIARAYARLGHSERYGKVVLSFSGNAGTAAESSRRE